MDEHTAPEAQSLSLPVIYAPGETREAAAERAAGPRGSGWTASDAGALVVTRPPENTPEKTPPNPSEPTIERVLITGTDTLDAGFYVEFPDSYPRLVQIVEGWKRAASGTKGLVVGGGRCSVSPGGKPNFPYHLRYPLFELYLSRHARPQNDTPNVFVSISSQLLWTQGEGGAVEQVIAELLALSGGLVREIRLSRADITADFLIPGGLSDAFLRTYAVKRSRSTKVFFENDQMQSFYVGSQQSDIQLRIYDKSAEIAHSDKAWFLDLWEVTTNIDVWRVEFQLRRPVLKSMGLNSLEDWMKFRGTLWRYLTGEWFSLRRQDNENAARRSLVPLWADVQDCASRFDAAEATLRRQRSTPSLDTSHLLKQLAGGIVGFSARRGIVDQAEAMQLFLAELEQEFRERDFTAACQQKAIELGLSTGKEAA